jgi:hypothetical protein
MIVDLMIDAFLGEVSYTYAELRVEKLTRRLNRGRGQVKGL